MIAEQSAAEKHFLALLLILVVVLVLGRLVAILFRRIKQPVVIGEILVGIALGPSLLGVIAPDVQAFLFAATDLPFFKLVASLGLVLFMFIVGMEVDLDVIRSSGKRAVAISLTSIALPFALGFAVLGTLLYDDHKCVAVEQEVAGEVSTEKPCAPVSAEVEEKIADREKAIDKAETKGNEPPKPLTGKQTDFVPFAMFIGVSMCGTAFAVLARILSERNMFKIPLGLLLIACAAIDDIVAFTLLALSTALAGQGSASDVLVILVELAIFTTVLFALVRPLLERLVLKPYRANGNKLGPDQMSILLIGLLLSAYITSRIGVHELIGAFLFGVAVPRRNAANLFHSIADRLEGVSVQLLLPVFFVIAGQGVNLQGLTTSDIGPVVLILLIACVGKFVGGAGAARLTGVPKRQSLAVGTMMNTRGLAELVILQVGRDAGVIDDKMYTMLVIMAIVTTAMAGPLLKFVYPDRWLNRDIADAERKRTSASTDRVVVIVDEVADALPLAEVAAAYGGGRATGSVTLVRFTDPAGGLESFADELGEMKTLRETVEAAGLGCQVITRASLDRGRDVVAEVERLSPGAVVIGRGDADLTDSLRHTGSDVLIPSTTLVGFTSVQVPAGGSNASTAALEMGVRLAMHADIPIVVEGSLSGRTKRQLRTLGVEQVSVTAGEHSASIGTGGDGSDSNSGNGDTIDVYPGERDRVTLVESLGGWVEKEPIILGYV